jgi:GTP-binding protein
MAQTPNYILTLADPAQIPELFKDKFLKGHAQSRIAFIGRSNVGKSSLLNALLKEKVARVSATPGKTRAIHFFTWKGPNKIVADLPGYGFAKVSKEEHSAWSKLLEHYFLADKNIEVLLMLFDSRHGPTDADLEALRFFGSKGIPIQIIMTKTDQLKTQSDRHHRRVEVEAALAELGIPPSSVYWVSIHDQKSLDFLRRSFT